MDFEKWRPWYDRIVSTFGFDRTADENSANLLEKLIEHKAVHPSAVQKMIEGETVVIFGCGPSIERNVNEYLMSGMRNRSVPIAADGATTPLLRIGHVFPRIVVTDLDGRVDDIVEAHRKGSVVVVHAHGDNMKAITSCVPRFRNVLGSTQVEPRMHVHNFGGFTDGDRSAFFAEEAGAKRIVLVGMDLGMIVGKYSKPGHTMDYPADSTKIRKLSMAKELLTWLADWAEAEILNATGSGEKIEGVDHVTLTEL
jgi:uncharacterized Rossmann fold enzyme